MNTLLARLYVLNFAGAALVAWAWACGHIRMILEADAAHMTEVIATLFVAGLLSVFWRARTLAKATRQTLHWHRGRLRDARKMAIRNEHIGDVVESLVILGLIGNAIGFLIGFHGVDVNALSSPEGLRAGATHLLAGVGSAFGSTIVGLSLALWTLWNNRALSTATALYIEDIS